MSLPENFSQLDRWPLYRKPLKRCPIPSKLKQLSFPVAVHSSESTLVQISEILDPDYPKDLYQVVYDHYNSLLAEPEKYGNFCGTHVATRRHEVLDSDPYFSGFQVVKGVAYLTVYDDRYKRTWNLAPETY
jgi:hypothetical protein